jgi:hypothetical protein
MPINYRTAYELLKLFDDISDEYDALTPEDRPRLIERLEEAMLND